MKLKPTALSLLLSTGLLTACGGGGSSTPAAGPISPPDAALVRVSQSSPYPAGCNSSSGVYEDAEVEPYMAINPANASNIVAAWQQDRFPDGGAHGLAVGSSMDGGKTWTEHTLPFSVCGGGNAGNNGNYDRASDPWVTFAKDGSTAYVISISFTGNTLQAGSSGAVLVSRSTDGGVTWSNPAQLQVDGASAFNDKESITADPNIPGNVYAVWDRLTTSNLGPAMFSRSTDGGVTWATKVLYDPGVDNQTLGNEIVGMSDGTLLDLFEEIDGTSGNSATSTIRVISSSDQGTTWSAPITVASNLAVGAFDPNTHTPIRSGAGLPQMAAGPGKQLAIVWEDGRFSNGTRDGIAYSASTDDGQTWSTPVQINSATAAAAFTPSVAILADGTVGVSYFDFRKDTAGNAGTLATDYWFTSSSDGVNWSEQHITGSFDMQIAPDAEGLFVGDYQALGKVGSVFVPFFVQTNQEDTSNRTDSFYLPPQPVPLSVSRRVTRVARAVQAPAPDAAFSRRVHENLMRVLKDEDPVWDEIRASRQQPATQPP